MPARYWRIRARFWVSCPFGTELANCTSALPCATQDSRRDWIVRKKQQQRTRGYTNIKPDSKYTGRKRKDRF